MQKYVVLEKKIGQTPLACAEKWRREQTTKYQSVPITYAGRLDPMASGKLLILLGNECKNQTAYRNLDKEYKFEVLFCVHSDTADVLGRLTESSKLDLELSLCTVQKIIRKLTGKIELPYPHFSSKTVKGKPLHTWTLEGRVGEIKVPSKKSIIHSISCTNIYTQTRKEVHTYATEKIETIPPVTEILKTIGNDFRRADVRKDWKYFVEAGSPDDIFHIAKFRCIASSGTYMRTLSEVIAKALGTYGLAYSIHRTKIGTYKKIPLLGGYWIKKF